jgi:uncharacterized phage protein gp47/JayE
MAITFKTPDEIADDYLTELKVLKPEVDIASQDSDWWIRSRVVGGVVSGAEADVSTISDDAFPQSARHDALEQHLITYFGSGFIPAQAAVGSVLVTSSVTGQTFPTATQFVYQINGNTYQSTSAIPFGASLTGVVPIQSIGTGQAQNLFEGTELTLPSPPTNFLPTAVVFGANLQDGRDQETDQEAVTRILARIQSPPAGGNAADYEAWALAASPLVTSAQVLRFIYGLGTVGVIITAGTTNINAAIDAGEPIIRTPSQSLIDIVEAYIATLKPLTDCVTVLGPNEIPIDVTFMRTYTNGTDGTTIEPTTGLSYDALLTREIGRVIYNMPTGGRNIGGSGFVIASEIEEGVDDQLSSAPYGGGALAQILVDRQILPLSSSGYNRGVLADQIFRPGVITLEAVSV